MTRFVLVHGAWHGGWCWDRVAPRLRAAAAATGEGWRIPVPDPAVVGVTDPEDIRWLSERLTEHPLRSFEEPAERAPPPELPQRAVLAAPGPVPMDEMARALSIPATRIEGGHDLMVTSPEALTTTLLESA
ncbi:MAG TPA: hypothetical protein VN618_07550 [Solirubrobacteraceae bacterium]|nr:hypothetical protein [Solirubrobacteraceae bacterium]